MLPGSWPSRVTWKLALPRYLEAGPPAQREREAECDAAGEYQHLPEVPRCPHTDRLVTYDLPRVRLLQQMINIKSADNMEYDLLHKRSVA